jgi:hypothetical protein
MPKAVACLSSVGWNIGLVGNQERNNTMSGGVIMKGTRYLFFCFSMLCLVCFLGRSIAAAEDTGATRYLKCNIHYQQHGHDAKASYANWTDPGQGHMILPVNTEVRIGTFRSGFSITAPATQKEILFEYDEKRMNMSIDQYLGLITSPTPVSLDAFSKQDRKGITDGKAYPGMTKKGVMTALGYPATHRTPSPDSNTWIFWRNRFGTYVVQFDDKGIVTEVRR